MTDAQPVINIIIPGFMAEPVRSVSWKIYQNKMYDDLSIETDPLNIKLYEFWLGTSSFVNDKSCEKYNELCIKICKKIKEKHKNKRIVFYAHSFGGCVLGSKEFPLESFNISKIYLI